MRIVTVPCLSDNYAYLVVCEKSHEAAVIDPTAAEPVAQAVARQGVKLRAIWNTHHHFDHTGGNKQLLADFPNLEVVAHASDRVTGQTRFVDDGDELTLGEEVSARIIHTPGHTQGSICFYLEEQSAILTGDTLFCGGCGRLFEGSPQQMYESLSALASLPAETQIYCGHEYTEANLRFAAAVEPDSSALAERRTRITELLDDDQATIPSTIAEERATNPFLRAEVAAVIDAAQRNYKPSSDSPAGIFAALRGWKDRF
jgi:hydroxyacylglutathione hydrolase